MTAPLTDEQIAAIKARADRVNVMPDHPGSYFTFKDSAGDVPALLAEVERLEREQTFHWELRLDVENVLDVALGPNEEDGAGAGLVADVALLADRKVAADAEVARQAELLDRVTAQLARWRHIRNRQDAAAEMQAELDREVIS